ncbi:MAG: nucleotide exchange factor GrpE [bacterium]|nr:nucleotide exchange factor GrpE [bacterium]MDE0238749.1 nucleotide exchange factor GrpE [bacterium]
MTSTPETKADEAAECCDEVEAAEAEEAAADAEIDDQEARIAELEEEVSDLKDRLLRAAAETENIRKRSLKDVDDARKFATRQFSGDVLAVADNLARALEYVTDEARKDDGSKGLIEGVEMTLKEFASILERHGIRPVEAMGAPFDPNLHQAMFELESDDVAAGHVMQVMRVGYTIHDRLLRPAMVGVAKAPADDQT